MIKHKVDSIADAKKEQARKADIAAVSAIAFVALAESGQIDDATATEHAVQFTEWAYPVAYKVDQLRQYNGNLYRCLQAHTSQADYTPEAAASLWKQIGDPTVEWPEWSQPIGAGDTYGIGDKVSHAGKHWISNTESNVWEPGVYGWDEAE